MPACHAGDRRFESGRVRHPSAFPYAPSARPDGAFLCPRARPSVLCHTPPRDSTTRASRRPVARRRVPLPGGLVLVALVAVLAGSQLGLVGGSSDASPSPSSAGVSG